MRVASRPPAFSIPEMPTGMISRIHRVRFARFLVLVCATVLAAFLAPAASAEVLAENPGPVRVANAAVDAFAAKLAPRDKTASGTLYFKFRVNPLSDSVQKAEARAFYAGMAFRSGDRQNLVMGSDPLSWAYSAFYPGIRPFSQNADQLSLNAAKMETGRLGPYLGIRKGVPLTIVFKVEYVPGGGDRVTAWTDPDLTSGATESGQPENITTRFTADASFDRIQLVHRGEGPGWIFDGIVAATSFEDFVPAPLWRRTWFLVFLFASAVVASVAVAVVSERIRARRRILSAERERAVALERVRIARDLHDDLGSGLTEMLLLGELASKSGTDRLPEILSGLRRLHAGLDEVVWSIDPRNDSGERLAGFLVDYARRFVANSTATFHADIAEEFPPVSLSVELRHNLLSAVKEALNNAVRHSGAANIRLGMSVGDGRLRITVADDGSGMDLAAIDAGDGLRNMKERLHAVGGESRVVSRPGAGTEVIFELPVESLRRKGGE